MDESFREALFPEVIKDAPVEPWMRAVQADGLLVGFVMIAAPRRHDPEPFLWRLLIDRLHQRRGIGTMVLDALEGQCRRWGVDSILVSWSTERGSPESFYMRNGFVPTGLLIDGEVEARKYLG
jgi:diamine N-acetyltransferase